MMTVRAEPIVFICIVFIILSVIQPSKATPAIKYNDKFIAIHLPIACL